MPIIFVADDFGMHRNTNNAIIRAHESGILQAAALMMGQEGTDEAVALTHAYPNLQTGWHFHLNDSKPTAMNLWPWGSSPVRAGLGVSLSRRCRAIMRSEMTRQWELFRETGLTCHFVNSHHHLHAHPAVFEALVDVLGVDFKGWIRLGRIRFFNRPLPLYVSARIVDALFQRERRLSTWRSSDTLWGLDRLYSMKADEVRAIIGTLPEGFHEFLFHPRTLSCPDTQCLLELKKLLSL
jgi:predicted glycoside hydrolase/deacetylase ChbG (UPF0249 family)